MRADMDEVIIERPRLGRSVARVHNKARRQKLKRQDPEEAPKRDSFSAHRQHGWDSKSQTDLIGPLNRYLRKQVGRPWDKVFSEVCQHADVRSTMQRHLREHVLGFVTHGSGIVFDDDGKPWYWGRELLTHNSMWPNFYVDTNGLLRVAPMGKPWRRIRVQRPEGWVKLVDHSHADEARVLNGNGYIKYHGCWFEDPTNSRGAHDEQGRVVKGKQLSSRELRRLKLTNG
jgi:hypothetical protein